MPRPSIRVREAVPGDAATIVKFVRALAVFEREPVESVRITEADVLRDGFGDSPRFETLIAERDEQPVGFALFFHNYSTWEGQPGIWVEDIFVDESARGLGAGSALMAEIARIALARGCRRVELSVLDWNPARKFYARLGFRHMEEWLPYRLGGSALKALTVDAEA